MRRNTAAYHRVVRHAAIVAASLAVIGCADDQPQDMQMVTCDVEPGVGAPSEFLDLRVRFAQPALAGARTKLITYDATDMNRFYAVADVRVSSTGDLDVTWTDAYKRFEYQPIVYYVDVDEDGRCTPDIDLGERFISSAWNPVDDAPLESDLDVFPLPTVTTATCADVERCGL